MAVKVRNWQEQDFLAKESACLFISHFVIFHEMLARGQCMFYALF